MAGSGSSGSPDLADISGPLSEWMLSFRIKSGKANGMEEQNDHPATIDDYLAQFPEDMQNILNKIRLVIKAAAPEAEEKISYQMLGYYLNGGLIWFGAYKRHIGIYPRTPAMEASIEELSGYKGTKGSVHFPLDKPMPYELISKIVEVRVAENLKKK
jgi:uncharacterized protein YdhG (YjbR/CyaY superfamily)